MRKPQLPPGTIPAGATDFYHNPEREHGSTSPWRKCVEGQWYMFKEDRWEKIGSTKTHLFVRITDVLKQEKEWSGEGEPSIGSLAEFDTGGGNWVSVTVFAIKEGALHQVDVLFDGPEGWGVISLGSPRLRPVRTAEQIAEQVETEKKATWVREALGKLSAKSKPHDAAGQVVCGSVLSDMYHAGYTV